MGLAGLFLKQAFVIPVFLHLQTDWQERLRFNGVSISMSSQIRRSLRAYYRLFDQLITNNTELYEKLIHSDMGFDKSQVEYYPFYNQPSDGLKSLIQKLLSYDFELKDLFEDLVNQS